MNVVLMFYTFGEIEQMEKTVLIQSTKTETSFDVKLIQGNKIIIQGNKIIYWILFHYLKLTNNN